MVLPRCPFHVECPFHIRPTKTEFDEALIRAFCSGRCDTCAIADHYTTAKPVPRELVPMGMCAPGVDETA